MATSIIKKAAKAAVKELGEDVRIDRRNMFRFPQKDQPLMEIPKSAPTVTEKTLEVAPEGVKGEKVTKSVIDTPVSRRTVVKSAGSQLAQNVVPKAAPTPQLTAQELFGSAKSMPDLYASMLPLVRKVAPEELASMADRLGFTIDDIIAMSGQDLLPRGDLTMEGLTRFEELFPITASRVLKKAGGGFIKKAAKAVTKLDEPVDPARRSFFSLPESTNLPAPAAPPAPAPAVSGLGALEKAAQAPVSRRDVLKSAAGQAARTVMPSGLEALAAPVARSVAGQAAKTAASQSPMSLQALIIQQISKELEKMSARDLEFDPDRVVRSVARKSGAPKEDVRSMTYNLSDVLGASEYIGDFDEKLLQTGYDFMRPSEVMKSAFDIDPVANPSPFAIKPLMRDMKEKLPDQFYDQFKSGVRRMTEDKNDAFAEIYARDNGSIGDLIDDTKKKYLSGQISRAEMEKVLRNIQNDYYSTPKKAGGGIIKKGVQTAAKTEKIADPARRSFFRLPESTNLPATVNPAAPAPAPSGLDALNRAAQAPVSRRDVLKSAAGQAARAVMPSGLEALAAPVAKQVASEVVRQTAAPAISLTSPLAIVVKMMYEGKSADEIAKSLSMDPSSFQFINLLVKARHPESYLYGEAPVLKSPSEALTEMLGVGGYDSKMPSPFALRPELRQLEQAKPGAVDDFIRSARAVSKNSVELAQEVGLKQHWIDKYLRGEIKYEDLPKYYQNKMDRMLDGFDSYQAGGIIKKAAQAAAKAEPKEQKMLQGFYRGYSGNYDAQRAAQEAGKVYVTPQKAFGDFYADKRAVQTGQEPHLEMILADPFAGKAYGHAIPGTKGEPPKVTKARQLKPEDVKSTTRLYAEGGPVAGAQFNEMVSNAMKNGMSEAEALRQLLPLFR